MSEHIGSFIPLNLGLNELASYYPDLIALNRATSALQLIVKTRGVKTIHVPAYCCQSVFDGIAAAGAEAVRYGLNEKLLPTKEMPELREDEYFLFVNFFGVLDCQLEFLRSKKNLIVDNAHAFFCPSLPNVPTFYSARKFFGVADGAYLYDPECSDQSLELSESYDRYRYMLMYADVGQEKAYLEYSAQEKLLSESSVMKMSRLTEGLLNRIPYERLLERRKSNFYYLTNILDGINQLKFDDGLSGPLYYPLMLSERAAKNVRQELLRKKIFTPCFWDNVLQTEPPNSVHYRLASSIVPLPIDHRYDEEHMRCVSSIILENF